MEKSTLTKIASCELEKLTGEDTLELTSCKKKKLFTQEEVNSLLKKQRIKMENKKGK